MKELFQRVKVALEDRYSVVSEIGRGGMAVVYMATDLEYDRTVAIKVLLPDLASGIGVERFLREIRVAAQLSHPRILPLLDSGETDGLLYFVMPFVQGESVRELLGREGQLGTSAAVEITVQVANALAHAHRRGFMHRDVKPENILLSEGLALLADFGVARAVSEAAGDRLTHTAISIGTPRYMSPEQTVSSDRQDGRGDQYSLACVLYEMLAGTPPFTGATPQAVLLRHVTDPVPPLRTVRPSVPEAVERAVLRALSKVPAERFGSMEEFGVALEAGMSEAQTTPPSSVWGAVSRLSRRSKVLALAGGALLAAGGWILLSRTPVTASGSAHLAILPCEALQPGDSLEARYFSRGLWYQLQGFESLRLVPLRQSFGWADEARQAGSVSPDSALNAMRARLVASCQVDRIGADSDSVSVRFSLSAENGRVMYSGSLRGAASDWQRGVRDSVTLDIVSFVLPGRLHSISGDGPLSSSVEAVQALYRGEEAFLKHSLDEADRYFGMALDADPDFALAEWRRADVNSWQSAPRSAVSNLTELYRERAGELGRRDSLLVSAVVMPPGPAGYARFGEVLEELLDDAYAMLLYGEELFHRGPLWGIGLDSIENVLRTATRLDPRLAPAWDHLVQVQIRLGKQEEARNTLAHLRAANPTPVPPDIYNPDVWRQAFKERFEPAQAGAGREQMFQDLDFLAVASRLVRYVDLPATQLDLGKMLREKAPAGSMPQITGLNASGIALMSLGRPGEALSAFDAVAEVVGDAAAVLAAEWRVIPYALALEGFSEAEGEAGGQALERVARDDSGNESVDTALRARATYALALLALRRGDDPGAELWTTRLSALEEAGANSKASVESDSAAKPEKPLTERLGLHLKGVREALAGRPERALEITRPLVAYDSVGNELRPFGRAAVYLSRGDWFTEIGAADSAVASWTWHLNMDLEGVPSETVQASEVDGALGSHARLRIAVASERLGNHVRACRAALDVVRLWADADTAFSELVGAARRIQEDTCVP